MNIFGGAIYFALFMCIVSIHATDDNGSNEESGSGENQLQTLNSTNWLTSPLEKRMTDTQINSAAIALGGIAATIIGVTAPVLGATISVATVILQKIFDQFTGPGQSLWDQLENKIDQRIGRRINEHNFERVKNHLYEITKRIKEKGEKFGSNDLDFIIYKMSHMQVHDGGAVWNDDLPLPLLLYAPCLVGGYLTVIKKKQLTKCKLAKQLQHLRNSVVYSMKLMMRLRYEAIKGVKSGSVRIKYPARLRDKYYELTYEDMVKKDKFKVKVRKDGSQKVSFKSEIQKIQNTAANFLMKNYVNKINKFFTSKMCLGCPECPDQITKEEISLDYPKECYGSSKCLHPADKFGYSYQWCYVTNSWAYSKKPSLEKCMPVNRPSS